MRKFLVLLFLLCLLQPISALAGNLEIATETDEDVIIKISSDFGFSALSFELEYNSSVLEFKSNKFSDSLSGAMPMINPTYTENSIKVSVLSTASVTAGEICELRLGKKTQNYSEVTLRLKNTASADSEGNVINITSADKKLVFGEKNIYYGGGGSGGRSNSPSTTKLPAETKSEENNNIVLTIGKKDALVYGQVKENDVAPKIVNDRTMLPIRFIAEALGAKVIWTEKEPDKVVIQRDDIDIVIIIGNTSAQVNDKAVELDSPAFIENERTYMPLRFVSENLGAKVEWIEKSQQVIITK